MKLLIYLENIDHALSKNVIIGLMKNHCFQRQILLNRNKLFRRLLTSLLCLTATYLNDAI